MTRSRKPFVSLVLVAALASPAANVYSTGIPVVDIASIVQMVTNMIVEGGRFAKDMMMQQATQTMMNMIGMNQISSDEKIAANEIVRITDATYDTHRATIAMEYTPSMDACRTISVAKSIKSSEETVKADVAQTMNRFWVAEHPDRKEGEQWVRDRYDTLYQEASSIQQATQDPNIISSAENFLRLGKYSDPTYTPEEAAAASVFIDLVLGPMPASSVHLNEDVASYPRDFAKANQAKARKSIPAAVMASIRARYVPNQDGHSLAQGVTQMVNNKALSEAYLKTLTCTNQGSGGCMNNAQLMKELVSIEAMALKLSAHREENARLANLMAATELAIDLERGVH